MSGMIVHNNPHIDPDTLEERLQLELQRPLSSTHQKIERAQLRDEPSWIRRKIGWAMRGLKARIGTIAARSSFERVRYIREPLLWMKSLILLQSTRGAVRQTASTVEHTSMQMRFLEARIVAIGRQRDEAVILLASQLETLSERLDTLRTSTNARLSEVSAEVTRRQPPLEAQTQVTPLPPPLKEMELREVGSRLPSATHTTAHIMPYGMDSLFLEMSYSFRGSRADIKERVARYVPEIKAVCGTNLDAQVLDIGCGRGELLEVLRDAQIPAKGVDLNRLCVEVCSGLGLNATVADGLAALRATETGMLSAVAALHVVEHIPFEQMVALIDEAHRCLRSGGVLILETPNPESLMVGARSFYFDPTHRMPIPPDVLALVARERGYTDVRIDRMHPYPDGSHLDASLGRTGQVLNQLLFGPQDYCVMARRT